MNRPDATPQLFPRKRITGDIRLRLIPRIIPGVLPAAFQTRLTRLKIAPRGFVYSLQRIARERVAAPVEQQRDAQFDEGLHPDAELPGAILEKYGLPVTEQVLLDVGLAGREPPSVDQFDSAARPVLRLLKSYEMLAIA